MEINRIVKFAFVLICLVSLREVQAQAADSLMKMIESKAIIDYSKDTTTMSYGSTYEIGDTLGYCISYVKQPNCDQIKPLVQRLKIIADTSNLQKLTDLTRLLIAQYQIVWWDTKYRTVCNALWLKIPERQCQDRIISSLQSLRLYLLLLKNFNGDDKKVFIEVIKRVKIFSYCYDRMYSKINERDSLACNRIESLTRENDDLLDISSDSAEIFYQNKTYNFYFDILESKFNDWKLYLKAEIYRSKFVKDLKPNSDTIEIDRGFLDRIIQMAIANNSSILNDYLIENLKNPSIVKYTDGLFLLGTTDEPRFIPIMSKYLENKTSFYDENGDYNNYILGNYGKLYSREFFLDKLKKKLPKDKYLLAVSALTRVPNQEVLDFLNKEYRNQKDSRIKKELVNAIYQVHYRAKLPNRPSNDWFDSQRRILDSRIEKLEKTKQYDK